MGESSTNYCRLCAEVKSLQKLTDLNSDSAKNRDVLRKISQIGVDVSEANNLPKTVCFVCLDLLENMLKWMESVEKAQGILKQVFMSEMPHAGIGPVVKIEYALDLAPHDVVPTENDVIKPEISLESQETDENGASGDDFIENDSFEETLKEDEDDSDTIPLSTKFKRKLRKKKHKKPKNKDIKNEIKDEFEKEKIKETWSDYPWLCYDCNIVFKDLPTLRTHWHDSHKSCVIFKCGDCARRIANYTAFLLHVRRHRNNLKYCCDLCNVRLPSATHIRRHRIEDHPQSKNICVHCDMSFDTKEQLYSHLEKYGRGIKKLIHKKHAVIEDNLTCDMCNKTFKSRGNLQIHHLIHTNRSRDYTCDKCGKTFFNKGTLSSHMLQHDDKRPFKCEICGSGFKTNTQLRSHVGIHGGPRPFSCDKCGRCFRLRCQLKSHLIIHTDSMPHTCEYCGKAFRFKTILTQHLRQHTGAKPYSCALCQRDFTNWPNYNKHMKRRHGINTAKKKVTPTGVFPINQQTGEIQTLPVDLPGVPSTYEVEEWRNKLLNTPRKPGRPKTGAINHLPIDVMGIQKEEPDFAPSNYSENDVGISTPHSDQIRHCSSPTLDINI